MSQFLPHSERPVNLPSFGRNKTGGKAVITVQHRNEP